MSWFNIVMRWLTSKRTDFHNARVKRQLAKLQREGEKRRKRGEQPTLKTDVRTMTEDELCNQNLIIDKMIAKWKTPDATANPRPSMPQQFEMEPAQPHPTMANIAGIKDVLKLASDSIPYEAMYGQYAPVASYFPGFAYLAQLTQLPEYRKMVGRYAEEMTRKWIQLRGDDEADDARKEKMKVIEDEIIRHDLRGKFKRMIELDGYFGRSHLYVDVKKPKGGDASDDPKELNKPLSRTPRKIPKGSLNGFHVVEPVWVFPGIYNSDNPLKKDFYVPAHWYVMQFLVHKSRLLTMISRPVPDYLKAVYSFGGISLSQLAMPYVNNWLRTRDSIGDLVHSFSISGLKTNMQALLASGMSDLMADNLMKRAELFNLGRDNKSLMLLDFSTEEFFQFNVPLSGLHELQAQAQEQMASICNMPLIILLGISPSGLNADGNDEIRTWYDYIMAHLENDVRHLLKECVDLIQLDKFGDIDPSIGFIFEPLFQLSETEKAAAQKTEADRDNIYMASNVVSAEEVRIKLANDPDSGYNHLSDQTAPQANEDDQDANHTGEESGAENQGEQVDREDTRNVAAN